jgi:Flp pilus assembly pilin Flp
VTRQHPERRFFFTDEDAYMKVLIGQAIRRAARRDDGQDLLEYALLIALIAMVAIGAVQTVGNTINDVFWEAIANTVPN